MPVLNDNDFDDDIVEKSNTCCAILLIGVVAFWAVVGYLVYDYFWG